MRRRVLILGGGLSAYTAAREAVKSGCEVILAQDGAGASPFIHAFCTVLGEDDSAAFLYEDTLRSGCGQNDPTLVKILAAGAETIPAYIRELGLDFDREGDRIRLIRPLGASVARVASVGGQSGPTLLKRLKEILAASPLFRERKNTRAVSLILQNGRVTGARLYDRETGFFYDLSAGAVILATGGWCRLFPQTTTPADLSGDGIALAYQAGARLCDLEFVQFEPCAAVFPEALRGKSVITTLFYEGAVLRNKAGERFMLKAGIEGEKVQKDVLSLWMAREIDGGGGSPHGGVYLDCTAVPAEKWSGVYEAYWQRYRAVGIDLKTTCAEVAPAAHTSLGGVMIDEACRTTVPGLYACGEVTGGLHGANRLGGNAGLETLVFGALAGKSAAAEAADVPPLPERRAPAQHGRPEPALLREAFGKKLALGLGVERCEERLREGVAWIENALGSPFDPACPEEKRLENDLICARLALTAARMRRESCGCHVRLDSVESPEKYRITVQKQNGKALFEKKTIEVSK